MYSALARLTKSKSKFSIKGQLQAANGFENRDGHRRDSTSDEAAGKPVMDRSAKPSRKMRRISRWHDSAAREDFLYPPSAIPMAAEHHSGAYRSCEADRRLYRDGRLENESSPAQPSPA